MIDSHCHLDFSDFDHDRQAVLQRCAELGIRDIIIPAVSADAFTRTINMCESSAASHKRAVSQTRAISQAKTSLHLALGLHPIFIEQHQPQDLNTLDLLIEKHQPIAVGEIGLDFHQSNPHLRKQKEKQILFFTKQLIIAKHHQLPVIIHNLKAHDECLNILNDTRVTGGIIHAFNGSIQQAHKYIDLGFLLGFGGMLTFERSNKLRQLAKKIPLSAIALETDAPDMSVSQQKGQRNSPEYLPYVQAALAEIKSEIKITSLADVAKTTSNNVARVFTQMNIRHT